MKMNVYIVHFKNKQSENYTAFSYTQKDGKFYFHKSQNQDDTESFAFESEVMGIENLGKEA